jgi:hypothetical protein
MSGELPLTYTSPLLLLYPYSILTSQFSVLYSFTILTLLFMVVPVVTVTIMVTVM